MTIHYRTAAHSQPGDSITGRWPLVDCDTCRKAYTARQTARAATRTEATMTNPPTTAAAATRRVAAALTVDDANNATINTQKGSGWDFVTTLTLSPGQNTTRITDRLTEALNVRVEPMRAGIFVYWNQAATRRTP